MQSCQDEVCFAQGTPNKVSLLGFEGLVGHPCAYTVETETGHGHLAVLGRSMRVPEAFHVERIVGQQAISYVEPSPLPEKVPMVEDRLLANISAAQFEFRESAVIELSGVSPDDIAVNEHSLWWNCK